MDDGSGLGLTLYNELTGDEVVVAPHTQLRVVSNQYWIDSYGGEAGAGGQVTLGRALTISLTYEGIQFDQQYVGWFYFVSR